MENLPIDRALGIQWDVEKDAFNFRIGDRLKEETRREMLSFVASVYDPLGFAAPFVLPAKRILQELCRVGYGWDEKVPEDQLSNWREWRKKLPTLMTLAIPRCYKPTGFSQIQTVELHNFSDASLGGYGVASYLRLIDTNGTIHCSLLMGKSRVAPLKAMTVPRLELTAATVAVKIIHDASSPSQWYHVSSEFNPADHASRGIKLNGSNEAAITTWFHGAAFLWQPESEWPGQPTDLPEIDRDDKELRRKVQATTITQCNTMGTDVWSRLLHQYSSWYKLQVSVAWLIRFKMYLRRSALLKIGPLTVHELSIATTDICRIVQRSSFPREFASPQKILSEKPDAEGYVSPLRKLNPKLENGVLHVGGRLVNAPISQQARHPIILPRNHHVTELIVQHYHEQQGHIGPNQVLSEIRQKFWIVHGLATVKRVIGRCIKCRRWNAQPGNQKMAPLPAARVTP
ncbi:uncharacterized protein LOC102804413, partial [Saccoglossus kowalevskii]|uniref:Uncharacterized protein LOC102804413 n=1 Tax=Saccoglossus kowalevskii TaxID=10224 RepID=A0ABM0M7C6_SACKO